MESIPEGLDFPNATTSNPSTSQAWLGLIAGAHSSLDIASFYWTLTNNDTHMQEPSAQQVPTSSGAGWQQGCQWGRGSEGVSSAALETGGSVSCGWLDTGVWKQLSSRDPLNQGTCHDRLEASECQGAGLVTRD